MAPEMCRAVKAWRHLTLPRATSRTPATRVPYRERCSLWVSSTAASPTASRASRTPPVDSTREMAATRLGQVTQKLVGISRVRSFSITLGSPKGQRAATRNGRGARPSCRATASRSLELSAISYRPSPFPVRRRYSMAFKYTDRDRVVIERSVHHLAESWPLSRLRHDIHLLTRPDHAVVFTGG